MEIVGRGLWPKHAVELEAWAKRNYVQQHKG